MNIKGFSPKAVAVPPEESIALLARAAAKRRWLDEVQAAEQRAKEERERLKAEARNRAIRDFWRKDKPATVHHITEGRR